VFAIAGLEILAQDRATYPEDSRERLYLRSRTPVSRLLREEMRTRGVRVLAPAANGAVTVSVPASRAGEFQSLWQLDTIPPESKLGEDLRADKPPRHARSEVRGQAAIDVDIIYFADASEQTAQSLLFSLGASVLARAPEFQRITARVPAGSIGKLASIEWVQAIDVAPAPYREFNNSDTSASLGIPKIQTEGPMLTGEGVKVGVIDGGAIDLHPEFESRLTRIDNLFLSSHATHVAGTIAAAGRLEPKVKGMAPRASLYSYDFFTDVTVKTLLMRQSLAIDITNNSYGAGISDSLGNCNSYGGYGVREREFDNIIRESGISVVFAMGNDRDQSGCVIQPRSGFYTVARPASAKNVISVGATGPTMGLSTFSGLGPARDGRLKPDIAAPGVDILSTSLQGQTRQASGTSMATPAVTGLGALLIQHFRALKGESPAPALLKAIILNSATDLGNPGPDYSFGYGMPDASEAAAMISANRFLRSTLSPDQTRKHEIDVPAGTPVLRVMLAWSDLPAPLFVEKTLVNDLNLVLTKPDGSTTVLPLTLDPLKPYDDAIPAVNSRDNVEQVMVRDPEAGKWSVSISSSAMFSESQDYALTWSFAPVLAPPCYLTLTPPALAFPVEGGLTSISINSPNACPAWNLEPQAPWLRLSQSGPKTGSASVKVSAERNTDPGARESSVKLDTQEVKVLQDAPCVVGYISPGSPLNDLIGPSDCLTGYYTYAKLYKFTAVAGQAVAVEMRSQDFDAYVEILLPDGKVIAFNDDDVNTSNARIPQGAGAVFLPVTGEYTIVATSFDYLEEGIFNLTLHFLDGADRRDASRLVSECPADLADTLDPATASRLGRRGDIFPTHSYLFVGRIGQTFDATVLEAAFDSVLYLVSPGGALFAFNDDATPDGLSRINAILDETGLWRLEVSAYSPDMSGPYRARISGCEAPPQ
jgi:subtilisin family serine protease